jgi:DedD protein
MRGVFDEELEMPRAERDTELTLGNGMLLMLFFGLVLVCGLCFGLGYSVGHRSAQSAAAQPQEAVATALPTSGSAAKPSATTQAPAPQPAQSDPPPSDSAQPTTAVVAPVAQSQPAQPAIQPQVRPALPVAQPSAPPPSNARPAQQTGAGSLTVQIAAVSHQEDAEVLVSALRKRGYEVNARREGTDNLIHVRIGPFRSRDEASRWRTKLLNDGYNAIIQP